MNEAGPTPGRQYRRYVLGVLFLVYMFNFVDRQILAILSPAIKADLGLSDTQLGILKGLAFALFYAAMGIPLARLADRWNRVSLIAIALALWSGMTVLSGAAQNFLHLFLARVGVGVGEAGGTPPSHSVISDYFAREERATALALFTLAVPIGTVLGFLAGGTLTEGLGWRWAFVLVGLPGLLLALLVRLTIREPKRGALEAVPPRPVSGTLEGIRLLWSIPSFRTISYGGALSALCGYGLVMWLTDFLFRTHSLGYGDVTVQLALVIGLGGGIGTYSGGVLADRFGKRDQSIYIWLPGAAMLLSVPLLLIALFTANLPLMWASLFFIFLFYYVLFGPFYATVQTLAPISARALATAFYFFILAIAGAGIGPFYVGGLSDLLAPRLGEADALQWAIAALVLPAGASGLILMLGKGRLAPDLARRDQQAG